jgi:phosphoesterase RecJ-like protein
MLTFEEKDIALLKQQVEKANHIVISMHANVDGDSMGSTMALYGVLKEMGKKVTAILADPYPEFLGWIPYSKEIEIYVHHKRQVVAALNEADTLICMDFNAPHRTGYMEAYVKAFEGYKIMIDHHVYPDEEYFDLLFSYPQVSSTSELLFHILKETGYHKHLYADTASAIFCGIMTDTGSFSHNCNRPDTFILSGELIQYGFDVKKVHDLIYNSNSVDRLLLKGFAINQRLVIDAKHKTAYFYLTNEDLEKFNYKPGDTEGLVNYPLSIKGIEMAVLFTQRPDVVKISFRSKDKFAVNSLASEHFNGGGHKNAAGGKFFGTLDDAIAKFEELLPTLDI